MFFICLAPQYKIVIWRDMAASRQLACSGGNHGDVCVDLGHAPAGVKPLEVRCAHPVRLSPATHSQGHGRPCLQRLHPRQGFCDHVDFSGGHSHGMSHEKLHSVKKCGRNYLLSIVILWVYPTDLLTLSVHILCRRTQ